MFANRANTVVCVVLLRSFVLDRLVAFLTDGGVKYTCEVHGVLHLLGVACCRRACLPNAMAGEVLGHLHRFLMWW